MKCEYDGTELPMTPEGLGDACPVCEQDIADHLRTCAVCRAAPTLPDAINPDAVLGAFA